MDLTLEVPDFRRLVGIVLLAVIVPLAANLKTDLFLNQYVTHVNNWLSVVDNVELYTYISNDKIWE